MRYPECTWGNQHALAPYRQAIAPAWMRVIFALDDWWPSWETRLRCFNCSLDFAADLLGSGRRESGAYKIKPRAYGRHEARTQ